MKNIKKLGALLLTLVLILSLSVPAFAAGDGSDSIGSGASVTIKDKLIAYNPDETSIYAPAVTFAYAITAGAGGDSITDEQGVTVTVLPGNWSGTDSNGNAIAVSGSPTVTASNAYTMDNTLTADPHGHANEKDVTFDFSGVTFPKPGVYRYTVTRTITDENNALENKDAVTRSLDVYVKEESSGARSIYGYILHDITGDVTKDSTTKYDCFESEYKTSNLTVGKTLVNDSMMNGHKFPFSVTFTDAKAAHIMTSVAGTATVGTLAAGAATDTPTIANGATVKYIGIPNGFTASVYETNDVAGTAYTSVGTADTAAAEKIINYNVASNTASTAAATDETKTVAFTNTLAVISPTGVVLRVAPYVLMLAAGLVVFALSRKRRIEEEA